MEFRIIIPARYDSQRFPGKVLADIAGKPMLQHVFERAMESGAEDVVIATDDERISQAAQRFGATVCMTSSDHQSGTERLAEAAVALGFEDEEIVVCLQADEPLIPSTAIRQLAEDLYKHDNVKMASVCTPIMDLEEMRNPNLVKVVLNHRNYALYFSRSPVPFDRNGVEKEPKLDSASYYRHIGLYAYYSGFLQEYMGWDPSPLDQTEKLEQLRVLWYGGRIHMVISKEKFHPGVDVPADLERVKKYL